MTQSRDPGDSAASEDDVQERRNESKQDGKEGREPQPDGIELDTRSVDEEVESQLLAEGSYSEADTAEGQADR